MPDFNDKRMTAPAGSGAPFQVSAGVAAIRAEPRDDAEMTTQALHGETLRVFEERGDYAHVQLDRDCYVGWALTDTLSAPVDTPTHRISALRTYAFSKPNLKSAPHFLISRNGLITARTTDNGFVQTSRGYWITEKHLEPVETAHDDPAAIAEAFRGSPYLWGGRESLGLDCTGLTIATFAACGVALPRDSDMQFAWAGDTVEDWRSAGALQRNDLVFWKGHVGIMLDGGTLLHANAHHMATASESLAGAIERIAVTYGEPIGAKRIDLTTARAAKPAWLEA